jgi:hypothetical protein
LSAVSHCLFNILHTAPVLGAISAIRHPGTQHATAPRDATCHCTRGRNMPRHPGDATCHGSRGRIMPLHPGKQHATTPGDATCHCTRGRNMPLHPGGGGESRNGTVRNTYFIFSSAKSCYYSINNDKFWEKLMDYFPLMGHVLPKKRKKGGTHRHTDGPLPNNDRGGIRTHRQLGDFICLKS